VRGESIMLVVLSNWTSKYSEFPTYQRIVAFASDETVFTKARNEIGDITATWQYSELCVLPGVKVLCPLPPIERHCEV